MDYRDWGRGDLARHERRSTDSWSDDSRDPLLGAPHPAAEEDPRPVGRYRHDRYDPDEYGAELSRDVDDDGLVPSGPYAPATSTFRTPSRRRGADRDDPDRYVPDWASGTESGFRSTVGGTQISVPVPRVPGDEGLDAEQSSGRAALLEPTTEVSSVRSAIAEPTAEVRPVRRGRHREPDPEPVGGGGRRRRADDDEADSGPASGRAQVRAAAAGQAGLAAGSTRRGRRRAADDDEASGGEIRSGRFIDSKSWETSAEQPLADSAEIAQWIRSPDPDRRRGGPGDIDRWWDRTMDPEEWARPAREWLDRDRPARNRSDRERPDRGRPDRSDRGRPDRGRSADREWSSWSDGAPRSRRAEAPSHAAAPDEGARSADAAFGFVREPRGPEPTNRLRDRERTLPSLESRWENDTGVIFRDRERDSLPERGPEPTRWKSESDVSSRAVDADDRDAGTLYRGVGYGGTGSSSPDSGASRADGTTYGDSGRGFRGREPGVSSEGRRTGTTGQVGRATDGRGWDRFTDTGQWDRFTDTTEWDRGELARIDPEALEDRYWPGQEDTFWSGTRLAGDDPRWMDTPTSAPRSPAVAYPAADPGRDTVRRRATGSVRSVRPDAQPRGGRSGAATRSGTATWTARPTGSTRRGFGSASLGSSRRLQDDLLDPNPGGPFLAVLYAAAWYSVPVLVFLVWLLTLDTSVPAGCVTDVTGGGCDSERARAMELVVSAAPRFGTAFASSLVCAVLLRWWGSTWRARSVGLAAAVVGGGISTVLLSVLSGQPIGG